MTSVTNPAVPGQGDLSRAFSAKLKRRVAAFVRAQRQEQVEIVPSGGVALFREVCAPTVVPNPARQVLQANHDFWQAMRKRGASRAIAPKARSQGKHQAA